MKDTYSKLHQDFSLDSYSAADSNDMSKSQAANELDDSEEQRRRK